jgi:hypothetical protein
MADEIGDSGEHWQCHAQSEALAKKNRRANVGGF